jgi:hypothetical protein
MKESLDIKLAEDGMSVQLIGTWTPGTIRLPQTTDKLLSLCAKALANYTEQYGKSLLILDFQLLTKISSMGGNVLEADVQDFAARNRAELKFINFPKSYKGEIDRRAIYNRLIEQDNIHFL